MIPCQPTHPCGQRDRCARFGAAGQDAIDASVSVTRRQAWCPMFIDRRGAALIGEELPMQAKPAAIGRPRGTITSRVIALIAQSGTSGMTLADLRQAMPGVPAVSVKFAAQNLKRLTELWTLRWRRITVYLSTPDIEGAKAAFEQRKAEELARQKALKAAAQKRYNLATAMVRQAQRQDQERLRAEHRARVEQAKQDRAAQRVAERERAATLHASKRAEIALNNRLAKKIKNDGTHRPAAERKPEPAAPSITWGPGVKHTISKAPPGRYEVLSAVGPFSSMKPGQYAFEASSCAAKRLEAA